MTAGEQLKELLERFYRPAGHRLGIVILAQSPPAVAALAADVLTARGHVPARRLARLTPRPDEPSVRPEDIADFLLRYGHEYSVAWFPAVGTGEDVARITAAAHEAGCAIGWDLTDRDADADAAELLHQSRADFGLQRAADPAGVQAYVRPAVR